MEHISVSDFKHTVTTRNLMVFTVDTCIKLQCTKFLYIHTHKMDRLHCFSYYMLAVIDQTFFIQLLPVALCLYLH